MLLSMRSRQITALAILATVVFLPRVAAGQEADAELAVAVGVARGVGGSFAGRESIAFDFLLSRAVKKSATPGVSWRAGFSTGFTFQPFGQDVDCVIAKDGRCAPQFPTVVYANVLGGVLLGDKTGSLDLYVGPAFVSGDRATSAPGSSGFARVGGAGRVTGNAMLSQAVGLTVGAQMLAVPNVGGSLVGIWTGLLGLRIY